MELPAESEPRMQVKGWLTEDAARELVQLAGNDLDKLIEAAKSKDFTARAARRQDVARLHEQAQPLDDGATCTACCKGSDPTAQPAST